MTDVLAEPPLEGNSSASHRGARLRRWERRLRPQSGFTLIEMVIVMALLGFITAMFAVTLSTTETRSSVVSDQNILQTEVRAALNTMVEDLRSATHGDAANPIIYASKSKITFFSPDRLAPNKMRRVSYWLAGSTLMRQVAMSPNSDGPPWTGIEGGDVGTISTVMSRITAPAIAAQAGAPNSGWDAGQVFKYCGQNPNDMAPLPTSVAPDPVTWTCTDPGAAANIKTVIVRAAFTPSSRSSTYTYGAVATLRWNAQ